MKPFLRKLSTFFAIFLCMQSAHAQEREGELELSREEFLNNQLYAALLQSPPALRQAEEWIRAGASPAGSICFLEPVEIETGSVELKSCEPMAYLLSLGFIYFNEDKNRIFTALSLGAVDEKNFVKIFRSTILVHDDYKIDTHERAHQLFSRLLELEIFKAPMTFTERKKAADYLDGQLQDLAWDLAKNKAAGITTDLEQKVLLFKKKLDLLRSSLQEN